MPVVEAFEREGFVWGGRWNQFDTFHFEYRPEYRIATGGPLPERLTRPEFSGFFGGRARGAAVERMSYAPRGPGALVCHRWVRQPGPNFGRCLSGTISPSGKVSAKPTVTRPAVTKGPPQAGSTPAVASQAAVTSWARAAKSRRRGMSAARPGPRCAGAPGPRTA